MVDIARLVNDFEGMKSEYLNADDKTTTRLYLDVEKHGGSMSVVKLNGRSNIEEQVAEYRRQVNFQGTTFGVAFTMGGSDYMLLKKSYNESTKHATLNITGSNIRTVCDAMVNNGTTFNSSGY